MPIINVAADRSSRHFPTNVSLTTHPTNHSVRTHHSGRRQKAKHKGYGGFPGPHRIVKNLIRKFLPGVERKLTRTLTIPVTTSLVSAPTRQPHEKHAPYIREPVRVGRNSMFDTTSISHDQRIEIAYLEYQSLGFLLWVIAFVSISRRRLAENIVDCVF